MKAYRITHNGQTLPLVQWCRRLHISRSFFSRYYHDGLTVEQIIGKHRLVTDRLANPIPGVDETLCWTCTRDGRTCPWMRSETPVPGWTAEPTVRTCINRRTGQTERCESYKIRLCPLYRKEDSPCEENRPDRRA